MSTEAHKAQLDVGVDASKAKEGFADVTAAANAMASKVVEAGKKAAQGVDKIGESSEEPAAKIDKSSRSMIASIQRTTAAMEAGSKSGADYYRALAAQRGVSLDVLKPYLDQLDAVTAKQVQATSAVASGTASMTGLGVSAKQTAAAMRGIPAQFTDIVTSLASGQAPMTVLLQQGGQLKDMFGGVGNAARALGTYIAGLISPITVLAAAAGGLAFAYAKGAAESENYAKALILSGNAAGATSGDLGRMAASISKVSGTQSAAAAALAEFAQSSAVGRNNLEDFTRAAIKFEATTGTAVSETVKQFQELAKSPLEASIKLNSQYNYLTESVYRQIKALEDQGKTTEAANLAQKAFADTLETRSNQMTGNLGLIEKSWLAVKNAVLGAGSALASIGRVDSPFDQAEALRKQLADRQARGPVNELARPAFEKGNEALKEQIGLLQEQERMLRRGAEARAAEAAQVKARIEFDKDGNKYLSDKLKLEQDINAARIQGLAAGASEAEIQQRIAAIREAAAKKGPKEKGGDPFAADREFAKEYAKTWEDFAKIADDASAKTDGLSKAQARLLQYLSSPAYAAHSEAMRQEVLTQAYAAINTEQHAEALKREAKEADEAAKAHEALFEAQLKQADTLRDQVTKQLEHNAAIGLSKEAIAALEVAKLQEQATAKEGLATRQEEIDGNSQLAKLYREQAKSLRELADAKTNGAIRETAVEEAKKSEQAWTKFYDSLYNGLTDSLYRAFEKGKGFFQSLWDGIKNLFKTTILKLTIQGVVGSIFSAVGLPNLARAGGLPFDGGGGGVGGGSGGGMGSATSWLTDFGGNVGNAANRAGGWLYNQGFEDFGSSLIDSSKTIGEWSKTIGDGFGYLNSALAISKGRWGEGIGSAIGTYFGGPIGSVIGSTVGKWVDNLFGAGGAPKTEGGYNSGAGTSMISANHYTKEGGYQGGAADATAKGVVDALEANYKAIVTGLGKQAGDLKSGVFFATDPNGKSQTQLLYETKLNGKLIYDRNKDTGGYENVGKSEAELKTAIELSSTKALVAALKETDLGPAINDYLKPLDVAAMNIEELKKTLDDVSQVGSFKNAIQDLPFDYLSKLSVKTTKALIETAGGLDALQSSLANYYNLFTSPEEKLAATRAQVNRGFKDINSSGVPVDDAKLAEWYKAEVARAGAMDMNIEANRKYYADLLKLASGVNAVDQAEKSRLATRQSWQDQLDLLTGKTTDLELAKKRDLASTTDESTKAIIRQVYAEKERQQAIAAAEAARLKAISDAKAVFDRAVEAERTRINTIIDTRTAAQQSIQAVFDLLNTSVRDLYNQVDTTAAQSAAQGRAYITAALALATAGGITPDQTKLQDAITASVSGLNSTVYASKFEQDRARLELAGELSQLKEKTGQQLTAAEQALKVAKEQLASLEETVKAMNDLIDAANGIDTSVKSVAEAIDKLTAALLIPTVDPTTGKPTTAAGGTGSNTFAGVQGSGGSKTGKGSGTGYYKEVKLPTGTTEIAVTDSGEIARFASIQAFASANAANPGAIAAEAQKYGVSQAEIATATGYKEEDIAKYFAAAGIPAFAVGTNYVPRDMLAQIHEGEAIVPKAYNPWANGAQPDRAANDDVVSELRALREEVAVLRRSTDTGNEQGARLVAALANGPILTEVA